MRLSVESPTCSIGSPPPLQLLSNSATPHNREAPRVASFQQIHRTTTISVTRTSPIIFTYGFDGLSGRYFLNFSLRSPCPKWTN